MFYYIDLETLEKTIEGESNRDKNTLFYICKTIEILIQFIFLLYEIVQMKIDFDDYC